MPKVKQSEFDEFLKAVITFILRLIDESVSCRHGKEGRTPFASSSTTNVDKELDEAYAFLGLSRHDDSHVTTETLNKVYKKLAMKYHPDRNGQSEKSVQITQKLNHFKTLIENDIIFKIKRRIIVEPSDNEFQQEVSDEEDFDDHMDFDLEDDSTGEDDEDSSCSSSSDDDSSATSDIVEKFNQKFKRERRKVKQEQRRMKREGHSSTGMGRSSLPQASSTSTISINQLDINTQEGRDWANELWQLSILAYTSPRRCESARKVVLNSNICDIDEDDGNITSNHESVPLFHQNIAAKSATSSTTSESTTKPIHLLMEQCTHEIAVALKLGMDETATKFLFDAMTDFGPGGSVEREEYMENPIDMDGNTILHYVCYYGSYTVVNFVISHTGHLFDIDSYSLFLIENNRGQLPIYFHRSTDGKFYDRVSSMTVSAKDRRENARLWPFIKIGISGVADRFDIFAASFTVSYFILASRRVFGCGYFVSLCFTQLAQKLPINGAHQRVTLTMLLQLLWIVSSSTVTDGFFGSATEFAVHVLWLACSIGLTSMLLIREAYEWLYVRLGISRIESRLPSNQSLLCCIYLALNLMFYYGCGLLTTRWFAWFGAGDDGLVAASETIESMELENNEVCAVTRIPSVGNFLDMGIEGYEGHCT